MNEGDGNRSFSDRRRDPLDVAAPNVANGKNTWPAGLEQIGGPYQRPVPVGELVGREVRAGFHKALLVQGNAVIQPPGIGNGAGHHEHVTDLMTFDLAGMGIAPLDPFERSVSLQRDDLRSRAEDDPWMLFDAADQIA